MRKVSSRKKSKNVPEVTEKQTSKSPAEHLRPYWFQKGVSGNPNGRPPNPLSWRHMIRTRLDGPVPEIFYNRAAEIIFNADLKQPIPDDILANIKAMTYLEFVTEYMLAKLGSREDTSVVRDMLELLSHLEGRPTTVISGPEGGPIQVNNFDPRKLSDDRLRMLLMILDEGAVKDGEEG